MSNISEFLFHIQRFLWNLYNTIFNILNWRNIFTILLLLFFLFVLFFKELIKKWSKISLKNKEQITKINTLINLIKQKKKKEKNILLDKYIHIWFTNYKLIKHNGKMIILFFIMLSVKLESKKKMTLLKFFKTWSEKVNSIKKYKNSLSFYINHFVWILNKILRKHLIHLINYDKILTNNYNKLINENNNDQSTYINLFTIGKFNKIDLDIYDEIILSSFNVKINLADMINKENLKIKLKNLEEPKDFIIEKIIFNKNKTQNIFYFTIYFNHTNNLYFNPQINENKFGFEYIYSVDDPKKLPFKLTLKNYFKIYNFDSFGIKLRRRFSILNVEDEFVFKKDFKDYPKECSYKICVRKNHNKQFINIHFLKTEEIKIIDIKKNKKELLKIINKNIIDEVKNFIKQKPTNINEILSFYKKIGFEQLNKNEFYKSYNSYSIKRFKKVDDGDFFLYKITIFDKILAFLIEILNNKEEIDFDKYLINCNNYIEIYEREIKEIFNFSSDKIIQFQLFRNISEKLFDCFVKNYNLNEYEKKISYIDQLNDFNPYKISINFLHKLIDSLNEESYLFNIFSQYNSKNSLDLKNFKNINERKNYLENFTNWDKFSYLYPELNMLTVNVIKNHLINVIPNFIIRYKIDDKNFSNFDLKNKITSLNEQISFFSAQNNAKNLKDLNEIFENNKNCYKNYSTFTSKLFIQENLSHSKVDYYHMNESTLNGPLYIFDIKTNNFVCNKNHLRESGILLERIINDQDNRIEKILCNKEIDNSDLLNIELWNQSDLLNLHNECLNKFLQYYNENENNNFILKNIDENEDIYTERQKKIIRYNLIRENSKYLYKFNLA